MAQGPIRGRLDRVQLMPRCRSLDLDGEFHEAVEQRGLPVQTRFAEPPSLLLSSNPNHVRGRRMRDSVANAPRSQSDSSTPITGTVHKRQRLRVEPIVGRSGQRPENDAGMRLRPRVDRVPIEITEVHVPKGYVKEKRLQGPACRSGTSIPLPRRVGTNVPRCVRTSLAPCTNMRTKCRG